jgi:hypothetical protein
VEVSDAVDEAALVVITDADNGVCVCACFGMM